MNAPTPEQIAKLPQWAQSHIIVLSNRLDAVGIKLRQNQKRRMKKLIASGEKEPAKGPLTSPCSDCPMRRDSLNGWLGGSTPEQYVQLAHSDERVDCHVHAGSRCAGMAIYRRNVCKWQPPEDKLPQDKETVFARPEEFVEHHNSEPFQMK